MPQPVKKAGWSRYFNLRIDRKTFATLAIFIIIYLTWLIAFPQFGPIINDYFNSTQTLSIDKGKWIMLFLASMSASCILSGYIVNKTQKKALLIFISTLIISALTLVFSWLSFESIFLFAVIIGAAAGISPVAWGAYFADHTSPEDRGRIMGISVGLTMLIAQSFLIITPLNIGSLVSNVGLVIIGSLLLITFATLAFRPKEKIQNTSATKSRRGLPPKQITLYAIPIFLFNVVAGILLSMGFPTIQDHVNSNIFYLIWAIPLMLGAIFAGIQLDLRGRKIPAIIGLAITGVSLAVFAILGVKLGYLTIIPLALGYSFLEICSLIIWADLAAPSSRGKLYGLGFGLITAAQMVGLILSGTSFGSASASQMNVYMLFSSLALFLCIPPLLLAEEALPKELIEKRQLLDYLDRVIDTFGKKD